MSANKYTSFKGMMTEIATIHAHLTNDTIVNTDLIVAKSFLDKVEARIESSLHIVTAYEEAITKENEQNHYLKIAYDELKELYIDEKVELRMKEQQ